MASINWQENSPKNALSHSNTQRPSGPLGFIIGILIGAAFSMALMGLIIGYAVGKGTSGGGFAAAPSPQVVAQAPTAPTPPAAAPAPQAPSTPPAAIDPKTDRIRGDLSKATVALIEYSDFECPFCKRHFPTIQQVISTYGDKVAFVYRDFPLSFHQNAHKEAEAGRCVFEQGGNAAFFKYHDYVFDKTTSNGTGFPLDQLPVAAKQAGVDVTKFQSCLDGGKYAKTVDDQETEGQNAGVQGTPGNFIVNLKTQKTQVISGAVPFPSFQTAIDAALKS